MIRVALIGDFDARITAHQAIPRALELAAAGLQQPLQIRWLPTAQLAIADAPGDHHGFWCVPGSPYVSMDGALRAIRYAREQGRPLLGTCGGFQHVVIEYARHVLGWTNAAHAETDPEAELPVISPLECALVETSGSITLLPDTLIAQAYGTTQIVETYHCSYGLNPRFRETLATGDLRVSGEDAAGEVRALELRGHPFFVATLFQPERAALRGEIPALAGALVRACINEGAPWPCRFPAAR
jgi:CTP synthase (UTP-ammonia lyase)